MKKAIYIIILALAIVAAALIAWQSCRISRLIKERDGYRANTHALLGEVETYKVRDSLSAAKVEALTLTLNDYKRFRAEDADLIKSLKSKNRDLAAVTNTQAQTIISLQSAARDTVFVRDSVIVSGLSLSCGDAWYQFNGVLVGKDFRGQLKNREELMIVESVEYKRFLCFLWKTKEIKSRQIDVVSKNPHTTISDVEIITITK